MSARNFIQFAQQDIRSAETCDRHRGFRSTSVSTIHEFCVQEKKSATISKLLPKLNDRINFKGGSTRLRNIMKELGFLWKKTISKRMVLIEKHDVRCMRVIVLHAGGRRGFIPNALVIFSCDCCDQTLNLFVLKIACKDYQYLLRKYTSGPVFFA
jgi:hypothetical protein